MDEPANITARERDRLLASIEELTRVTSALNQALAVHTAKQDDFERRVMKTVDEHDLILRGSRESVGLIGRTDKLEQSMNNINKAAWAFFAPAIALVFIGLLVSIYLALKGGLP